MCENELILICFIEALKRELIIPRTPPPRSPTLTAMSDAERDRLARERLEQLNVSVTSSWFGVGIDPFEVEERR
jgi:hypothetical protein